MLGVVSLVYRLISSEHVGDKGTIACRFSEEYGLQGYPRIGDYKDVGCLGDADSVYPNERISFSSNNLYASTCYPRWLHMGRMPSQQWCRFCLWSSAGIYAHGKSHVQSRYFRMQRLLWWTEPCKWKTHCSWNPVKKKDAFRPCTGSANPAPWLPCVWWWGALIGRARPSPHVRKLLHRISLSNAQPFRILTSISLSSAQLPATHLSLYSAASECWALTTISNTAFAGQSYT